MVQKIAMIRHQEELFISVACLSMGIFMNSTRLLISWGIDTFHVIFMGLKHINFLKDS